MSEHLALLFSDGSISAFSPDRSLDDIREERVACDRGETDIAHLTKIARVEINIVEIVESPQLVAVGRALLPLGDAETLLANLKSIPAEVRNGPVLKCIGLLEDSLRAKAS